MRDGKDREAIHFIVVASVVAVRAFRGHIPRFDIPFEHNLRAGGHFEVVRQTLHHFGFVTAQQTGKGIFRQGIRYRRHGTKDSGGISTQRHRHRKTLARMRFCPLQIIQRAATVRQPAHNQPVFAYHLLAIDAEILPLFVRSARHGQTPGNQRSRIARPAPHHRDTRQIDLIAAEHHLLTGGITQPFGRHIQHLLKLRHLVEQIAETSWRFRLFQKGQQLTHFAQGADILLAHAHGHALWRAKQVAQHRHVIPFGVFKQQSGATGTQGAVGNFSHLQFGIDRLGNAL